ncbi:MAG: hypothetical protein WDA18_08075 [Candidatus Ratteibacteria bacterium]|jgi:hypothetical protein
MNPLFHFVSILLLGYMILLPFSPYAEAENQKENKEEFSRQRYTIITERNIYDRNRSSSTSVLAPIVKETPPPVPEEYMVLVGIVSHDGSPIAFFEDRLTGRTLKLKKNNTLLNGTIGNITLDQIEYQKNGSSALIKIGQNLLRGTNAAALPPIVNSILRPVSEKADLFNSTSTTIQEPVNSDTRSESEILEELRNRRRSQLNEQ